MNRTIGLLTVAVLMQTFAIQGQQPLIPPTASLQGTVLTVGTNEAIAAARITLYRAVAPSSVAQPWTGAPSAAPRELVADGQGKFVFKDVEPGSYRMAIAANGFVKQEYGQKVYGALGAVITLTAGETAKNILIYLTPTGSISGNVRDSGGQPVVGVSVLLMRTAYNATGLRTFQVAGSGRTDDRGEFRAYFLTPGRYYVFAALSTVITRPADQGGPPASPNEVTSSFGPTFFPGVTDIDNATIVEVAPGQEIHAIDFALQTSGPFTIRGKVADPRFEPTLTSFGTTLASRSITGSVSSASTPATAGNNRYFAETGTFEFRGLSSGTYGIGISASSSGTPAARAAAFGTVIVTNADVNGVVLKPSSPISTSGRIRFEGLEFLSVTGAENVNLQFRPFGDQLAPSAGSIRVVQSRQADPPNGNLNIDGLYPGDYQIVVTGLPSADYYVKEIRFDGTDVLNQPLHFAAGARDGFEVLLSPRAARLTGTVMTGGLRPTVDAQVVLVPGMRNRIDLFRTAVTDKDGHFSLSGIPPGNYHLYAWEAIEAFAYFDPDFLMNAEAQAKPVRIEEGARDTIELRIIPVP